MKKKEKEGEYRLRALASRPATDMITWGPGGGEAAAYAMNETKEAFEGSRSWESGLDYTCSCRRRSESNWKANEPLLTSAHDVTKLLSAGSSPATKICTKAA